MICSLHVLHDVRFFHATWQICLSFDVTSKQQSLGRNSADVMTHFLITRQTWKRQTCDIAMTSFFSTQKVGQICITQPFKSKATVTGATLHRVWRHDLDLDYVYAELHNFCISLMTLLQTSKKSADPCEQNQTVRVILDPDPRSMQWRRLLLPLLSHKFPGYTVTCRQHNGNRGVHVGMVSQGEVNFRL